MTTPILGITEISGNQQNQYLTANEAFRALEASTNDFLSVDLSGGDVTLTPAQFTAAYAFVGTGHSLTRALTVPASKRAFVVRNAGTQNINVTRGVTIIAITAGSVFLLYTDGTADGLYSVSGGGGGGGGSTTWGSITGNINSQADLLAIFTALGNSVLSTGVTKTTDTIGLTALNDTTLRLKPVAQAIFYGLISTGIPLALRTFAQIDYPLASIPGIVADGIYIRFVGVNQAGAVITSAQAFTLDETTLQYGYIIIKRVAGINTFLDGAAGPRNVFTWPDFAGDNASINEFLTPESNISIVPNAALTILNSAGVIKGLGINWGTANVNERTKAAANPTSFITVNPSTILAASLPAAGTAVQVTQYWNGSVMTTMAGANNASVQRFLITIAGTIFLQVGEVQYASLDAAADAIGSAPFTNLLPNDSAVELCRFAARRGAVNLADGADAVFSYGSGTASGGSAGAGTNLSYVASPIDGLVQSSTGTSATLPLSTGVNAGLMAPAQNTKLAGINIGTTAPDVPNNTQLNVRLGTTGNLGTIAQQNANAVDILGGAINDTTIGATTRDSGRFTSLDASQGVKVGNTASADLSTLDWYLEGSDVPVVAGSVTPGTCTYSLRYLSSTRMGNRCFVTISVTYTGHTGTGNLLVSPVPFPAKTAGVATFSPYTAGIARAAGTELKAYVTPGGTNIEFELTTISTGASGGFPLPVAGTLHLTFVYEI